jgi:uncharacterized phage infection (PIP) family protein YhgE
MIDEKQLWQLKTRIDQAKVKANELQGRRDLLLQQLKDNWDCGSLQEAEKKVKQMTVEINEINAQLANGIAKVEEQLKGIGQ